MKYIYIVIGDAGEYEDHERWIHGVFATNESANAKVEALNIAYLAAKERDEKRNHKYWEDRSGEIRYVEVMKTAQKRHDRNGDWTMDKPTFFVDKYEVKL